MKKNKTGIFYPNSITDDFTEERDILTRRPDIHYDKPLDTNEDGEQHTNYVDNITVDDVKQQVKDLITGYKKLNEFVDIVEKKIDTRVGDKFIARLDKKVDSHVIDAISRCFPEAKDKTSISFEMYKQCLVRQQQYAQNVKDVSQEDIDNEKANPYRTTFGGYGKPTGKSRNEIDNPANNIIEPIDLADFKAQGIIDLFELMKNLILKLIISQIKKMVFPGLP
jgi:hypothetical protein